MTDTTQLPEATAARIKEAALEHVKQIYGVDISAIHTKRYDAYKKGATTEATRSLKLIQALEKLHKIAFDDNPKLKSEVINITAFALNQYKIGI
jgi:hypothetical protein